MSRWPKDNQEALIAFYGEPKSAALESQLVDVVPPFRMTFEGKPVKAIKFHKKAAAALKAALDEIWEGYGRDQAKVDAAGISHFDGSYYPRFIRGSSTRWSNHAFCAAIDLDAEHNGFNTGHGKMSQIAINAFKRQGARWGGDYHHRTDPMHFEFCDSGEDEAKVPQTNTAPVVPPKEPSVEPLLQARLGDSGALVKRLQVALNVRSGARLIADGNFGPVTEEAVKEFQAKHSLVVDGIVGSLTWLALTKV